MAFTRTDALQLLRRAHQRGRLAHAYLIAGPQGSGKRWLVENLCALVAGPAQPGGLFGEAPASPLRNPNIHTIEPESKSRRIVIKQVRELERELQMRPAFEGKKIGVIFEADRLQPEAANAFLKTLEEPPGNSLLLLTSAMPEAMLETILSRCIWVSLLAPRETTLTPAQTQLIEAVRDFFRNEKAGLAQGFLLARRFSELLAQARHSIQTENKNEFEREQDRYKQTTDADDWLESREDYYAALTEARYRSVRESLVETLLQFFADGLRQQNGGAHLDLRDFAADTAALARRFSPPQVLKKIAALEELRENFNRNVQEQLAIEVAFLEALAAV